MNSKTFITLVILCSFTAVTFAQSFTGGALLGMNASQVDGDNWSGYNKFGLMGGAFVYASLSKKVDIQLEIKYMGKGANKQTTETDNTRYTSSLNYIELPLLIRLNTKKFGWEAGLGFGYLFASSEKDEYGKLAQGTSFKPFELSTIFGIAYKLSPKFLLNLRYSYSVLSIANKVVDNNSPNLTYYRVGRGVYNNLFSLGVYYTIESKK